MHAENFVLPYGPGGLVKGAKRRGESLGERPRKRSRTQPRSELVCMDPAQTRELVNLYYETPAAALAAAQADTALFGVPFDVNIGRSARFAGDLAGPFKSLRADVRGEIISREWMPALRASFHWLNMFGFFPYYLVPVPDSVRGPPAELLVPRVPPLGSGLVFTFMAKREQGLAWKWSATSGAECWRFDDCGEDRTVYFAVECMPTLSGKYRSRLASALQDVRYLATLRAARIQQEWRLSSPMHVVEFRPNLGQAGRENEAATGFSSFRYPGELPGQAPTPLELVDNFRSRHLQSAPSDGLADLGLPPMSADASGGYYGGDGPIERYYRQNAEAWEQYELQATNCSDPAGLRNVFKPADRPLPPNTVVLQPYETYKPGAVGRIGRSDPENVAVRLDKFVSALLGFPLETIMDRTGRSSNALPMNDFTQNRMRPLAVFYGDVVRVMFYRAYVELFDELRRSVRSVTNHRKLRERRRPATSAELAEAMRVLDVHVIFPRTPDLTFPDVIQLYKHRMIDTDRFFRFGTDTLGLSGLSESDAPPEFATTLERLYPVPSAPEGSTVDATGANAVV